MKFVICDSIIWTIHLLIIAYDKQLIQWEWYPKAYTTFLVVSSIIFILVTATFNSFILRRRQLRKKVVTGLDMWASLLLTDSRNFLILVKMIMYVIVLSSCINSGGVMVLAFVVYFLLLSRAIITAMDYIHLKSDILNHWKMFTGSKYAE